MTASYAFSPGQLARRLDARAFLRAEFAPLVAECDRAGATLPLDAAQCLNQRFGRMSIPKEFGGSGLDLISIALILEEIAYVDVGLGDILGGNLLGMAPIFTYGSDVLRHRFAEKLRADTEGEMFFALAGTEPDSGSDVLSANETGQGLKTTAVRTAHGFRIDGRKRFISNGPIATHVVTLCATEEGPTLFVVDRNSSGFVVGQSHPKLGHTTAPTSELVYDGVHVPKDCVVGAIGHGAHIFNSTLSLARPGVAISSAGLARRAYEVALDYCRSRVQGSRPIIEHQAVQLRIARLAMKLEVVQAFALLPFIKAEDSGVADEKLSAMAKVYCSEEATNIVSEAMQLLGGNGYMRDHPIEKLYRDIKLNCIYEGENNYVLLLLGGLLR